MPQIVRDNLTEMVKANTALTPQLQEYYKQKDDDDDSDFDFTIDGSDSSSNDSGINFSSDSGE